MKVILKNSSLVFQKGMTETDVTLTQGHSYINRNNGNLTTDDGVEALLSDFIPVAGVTKFSAKLLYGWGVCPYWFYDSNQDPISDSCAEYNSQNETIRNTNTSFDDDISTFPSGAAYIRFSSYRQNNLYAKKYS